MKDAHTYGKKWPEMVLNWSFIKEHSFRISLYLSNKLGGWNKRGGGAKVAKPLNVEVGINMEVGIFLRNQ